MNDAVCITQDGALLLVTLAFWSALGFALSGHLFDRRKYRGGCLVFAAAAALLAWALCEIYLVAPILGGG